MTPTNVIQFPRLRAVGPVNEVLTSSKAAKRHEVDASVGIAAWPPAGLSQHLRPVSPEAVAGAERLIQRAALVHLRRAYDAWPEGDGRVSDLILDALIAAEAQTSRGGGDEAA